MDSLCLFDGSYDYMQFPASPSPYDGGLFGEELTTDLFSYSGLSAPYDTHVDNNPEACNPTDAMGQLDFSDFLNTKWLEEDMMHDTGDSEVLASLDTPITVPAQIMAPPPSAANPLPLVPSTPKRISLKTTTGSVSGLFSPPPSDRPFRTRRHNGYEEIRQLSELRLNTRSAKSATKPSPVFAAPLPPTSIPDASAALAVHYNAAMRYLSPSSSSYSSGSSTATVSPIDSPSSNMSDTFGAPLSPLVTPVRRPARQSGADRPRVSQRDSSNKPYSRRHGRSTSSVGLEKVFSCRHPGNIVPGDIPCNKDFARKHDWVRHQRVHTGQTPYECFNCGKSFKRSDARSRHWDSPSNAGCEAYHTRIIKEQLRQGEITADHPDAAIIRRRAQKAAHQKESDSE
ncbi:hypothetical protein RSOLAG1IB_00990 [Rhizoctonia solani AG-1 IB]|uniref:C2H2-type domain-containing protein n=1 Tax=Thanatephorus cucumeris (strain AG1-IB / isolate 7/3/14) TaxID=1108050 RepID=A0A0B7F685_THACB|nr:hypothetical protein RSOLAG1IB_00990 [Rhizoctonia solani AG-1 IB]